MSGKAKKSHPGKRYPHTQKEVKGHGKNEPGYPRSMVTVTLEQETSRYKKTITQFTRMSWNKEKCERGHFQSRFLDSGPIRRSGGGVDGRKGPYNSS